MIVSAMKKEGRCNEVIRSNLGIAGQYADYSRNGGYYDKTGL
jgi:hypothetical protein